MITPKKHPDKSHTDRSQSATGLHTSGLRSSDLHASDPHASDLSSSNPITSGVIWQQMLLYFAPLLLASVFQLFYNTVDTIIVGRYVGKIALTAVGGSAGQIYLMVTEFLIGASAGATVLISQAYGARKKKLLDDGLHNAIALALVCGVLFTALGVGLSRAVLILCRTPADTFDTSLLYLRIVFCGLISHSVFNMGAGVLRAIGDSERPLRYLAVCSLLNVALDYLFVAVLHLGIGGAAFATIFSQTVSAVLVLRAIGACRKADRMDSNSLLVPLSLRHLRLQKPVVSRMLLLGVPLGFESLMYTFSCVVLTSAVNTFGTDTVAAYAGFVRIESFYWILEAAFAVSITTFVGQNLGAGFRDRVRSSIRQGAVLMYIVMGSTIVLMYAGCRVLLGLFTTDPDVLAIGVDMMRYLLPFYILYIPNGVMFSALRGMGDSLHPTLITFVGVCLLRIVWVIFVFPHFSTIKALLFCFPMSWVTTSVIYFFYYRRYMKRIGWR